jgi:beta-lactamase class C
MHRRLLVPLGMSATFIPERGELAAEFPGRVVQGYAEDGQPVGTPGDQQSYFDFPGTGQMFSSPRDLATFVAAELGELPLDPVLRDAMQMTQQAAFRISPRNAQGMAWEVNAFGGPPIVDKPGGLDNASTYVGLVPSRKLGLVILSNRGNQYPHEVAREKLLPALERASRP